MGCGGFTAGIGQSVVEGVADQGQVVADGRGQLDEFGDTAAGSPGDPPGEQDPAGLASRGEHRAELLLEQVGPIETVVGLSDGRDRGALLAGEVAGVVQYGPAGAFEVAGLVGVSFSA